MRVLKTIAPLGLNINEGYDYLFFIHNLSFHLGDIYIYIYICLSIYLSIYLYIYIYILKTAVLAD